MKTYVIIIRLLIKDHSESITGGEVEAKIGNFFKTLNIKYLKATSYYFTMPISSQKFNMVLKFIAKHQPLH